MAMMIRFLFSLLIGLSCLTVAGGEFQAFYRLLASTNSAITGLSPDGVLTWSNAANQGTYLVEKLSSNAWTPVTRSAYSNSPWSVKVHEPSPPDGMLFIPGGRFQMGDSQNDTNVFAVANPVHTVQVNPFFMDRYEFTNERLRDVLQWARDQGLIVVISNLVTLAEGSTNGLVGLAKPNSEIYFSNGVFSVRSGRGNFPAPYISWFGAVACCNFLSAMSGRELCYDLTNWTCNFSKKGYRLPTESEWEFAARGGYETLRFPWADTNVITHSYANYRSDTNNWYDVSPTRGFHPAYVLLNPRSSPVGVFAPNNYDLYDMAGNIWEWTWDWHGRYPSGMLFNPTGPATGFNRIFRGGSWFTKAERLTCAMRYPANPFMIFEDIGFRLVLPYPQ
jgi:formylglycine-generating enzyme